MTVQYAAGYNGQAIDYFRPDVVSSKVKMARVCESISHRMARSDFLSMGDVMQNRSVTYMYVPRTLAHLQSCGMPVAGCQYLNQENTRDTLNLQHATVQVCNHETGDFKIDRLHEQLMTPANRAQYRMLLEKQIKQNIIDITDAYALNIPIAQAADYNMGRNAGKMTRSHDLGDASPGGAIKYTNKGDARKLMMRMLLVAEESGVCDGSGSGEFEFYMSPGWAAAIQEDFSSVGTGGACCATDPSLTGRLVTPYGHKINKTIYNPCTLQEGSGKRLEYIVLVSKNDWGAPYKMHYMNYETRGHQIHFPYAYSHDSWLFDREGAVVAVVEPARAV